MSRTLRSCLLTLAVLTSLTPLYAITYIVPQDRDLVQRADAIAVVTAGESHAQITADGRFVTVVSLTVGERIKGDLATDAIQLVEPGGIVGDRGTVIPGSPRYEEGKSYLVFLRKSKQGDWATYGFQLGQFELTLDINGSAIATRMGQEREVFGFNEEDWSPHSEKLRDAKAFLNFVRGEATQVGSQNTKSYLRDPAQTVVLEFPEFRPQANFTIHATATRADYLLSGNFRWQNPSASFRYCCAPTFQPAPFDGPGASSAAMSNWNGVGVGINYTLGTPNTAKAIGPPGDGQNTIVFNDANGELAGAFPGAAAYGQITVGSGSYSLGDGITYIAIQEVDVVVAKNLNFTQSTFVGVMTHELGHTLGFRHSNQDGGGGACGAPLVCTTDAVMNSSVASGLQSLRPYDVTAAQTVYGSGPVCTPPSITGQPQSQTIAAGASAQLSVTAGGSSPFTYQWYIGNPGTTTNPVPGGTTQAITVSPSATTTYFVRVTGQCTPTVDSAAVTITVAPCQNPAITQQPIGSSVSQGSVAQLTVGATGSGLTYQWYQGASAGTATPSTGTAITGSNSSSISVFPSATTFYSVRVSGACGTPVSSNVVQVTVTPPGCPTVNAPSPSASGGPNTFTLSAFPSGGTITNIAWFTAGGGTTPFSSGTQTSITVTPNGQTTYFYQATNSCGNATNSGLTTVTPTGPPPCAVTVTASGPAIAIAGANFSLSSNATGTGLSYQWYRGNSGDTSSPIAGATSPSFTTSITSASSYFVRVTASCGQSANSNTVTVNVNTGACTASTDLCLDGLRYKVSLVAKDPSGKTVQGKALYQTDVFGYFSLAEFTGDDGNPEVFVKVLGPLAKGPVVFYSGLTNLDYVITVTDLQTGRPLTYHVTPPPSGSLVSKGDFDFEGNTSTACADITVTKSQESPGSCVTDGTTLCLLNRFRVTMVAFDDRTNKTVSGQTIPKNSVFGFFSTPGLSNDPSNVEAFVKAINATSFDGHYWIFLGGLTDVQYTIKVVDTTTGKTNSYFKPLRSTCGLNDVTAFNAP